MPVKRADPASPQIRTEAVNDKKKVSRLKWVALYFSYHTLGEESPNEHHVKFLPLRFDLIGKTGHNRALILVIVTVQIRIIIGGTSK